MVNMIILTDTFNGYLKYLAYLRCVSFHKFFMVILPSELPKHCLFLATISHLLFMPEHPFIHFSCPLH